MGLFLRAVKFFFCFYLIDLFLIKFKEIFFVSVRSFVEKKSLGKLKRLFIRANLREVSVSRRN